MTTEKILTDDMIHNLIADFEIECDCGIETNPVDNIVPFARAIEQAVLQSPKVRALRKDAERIQFVADKDCMFDIRIQADGTTKYRLGWNAGIKWQDNWFDSPSAAIDAAMENQE